MEILNQMQLEQALERRITEASSLVDGGGENEYLELSVRKKPCRAIAKAALSDPKRAEKGGLQYQLIIGKDQTFAERYSVLVNVRVAPRRGSNDPEVARLGNGAYVAIYVEDPHGVEDSLYWRDITELNLHPEYTTSEWYEKWLSTALIKNEGKLFKYMLRMT